MIAARLSWNCINVKQQSFVLYVNIYFYHKKLNREFWVKKKLAISLYSFTINLIANCSKDLLCSLSFQFPREPNKLLGISHKYNFSFLKLGTLNSVKSTQKTESIFNILSYNQKHNKNLYTFYYPLILY